MRILISGGFGFVGGRIAKQLTEVGYKIILGSRSERSPPLWLPHAKVEKIDWHDSGALIKSCHGIDIVIQCAGVNAIDSSKDPEQAFEINGMATTRLALAAKQANVKCFIYLSTAHIYANPLLGVITENTIPANFHPYAASHLMGEAGVMSACQNSPTQAIILRLANAYGVPMHMDTNCWNLLANELCRQAINHRHLTLNTSGQQERNFIGLDQVCNAVEYIIAKLNTQSLPTIFNIGSLTSTTVLKMAQNIQERCFSVLGFYPTLEINNTEVKTISKSLDYKICNIQDAGFMMPNSPNYSELDELLTYCKNNFAFKL